MTLTPLEAGTLPDGSGRKAQNLAWLHRHGFRVPQGWVLPADVDHGCRARPARGPARSGRRLRGAVLGRRRGRRLDDLRRPVPIRARRPWRGRRRPRPWRPSAPPRTRTPCVGYAERAGVDPSSIRMAVVIQRMVDPVVSGVAFSKNPLSGLDEVVIEAVPGRGDALVQDGVTPDRWIHRWGELTERPDAAPDRCGADGPDRARDPADRRGLRAPCRPGVGLGRHRSSPGSRSARSAGWRGSASTPIASRGRCSPGSSSRSSGP